VLPQTSVFTGVSEAVVVPGMDAAPDVLFVAYSPDGQSFELARVDQTGVPDGFGNPTFSSTVVASLPAAPAGLTAAGGRLFFLLPERVVTLEDPDGTLHDELTGPELWTSDGTEAGTTTVAGFAVGTMPVGLTDVDGRLFLAGDLGEGDGVQLFEVVVEDVGGVQTLYPAPIAGAYAGPAQLAAVDGKLYFTADDQPWFTTGADAEPSQFLNVEVPDATVRVSVLDAEGDLAVSAADATAEATALATSPILPAQSGVLPVDITEQVRAALADGRTRLTIRLDEVVGADDASFDLAGSTLDVTTRAGGVLADLYTQEGGRLDAGKSLIDLRTLEAGTYFLRVYDPEAGGDGQAFAVSVKAPLQGDVHPQTDRDTIRGGDGDDLLVGNAGVDRLFGDSGDDAYRAEATEIRDLDDGESVQPPAAAEIQNQKPRPVDVLVNIADPYLRAAIGEALGKPVTTGYDGQPVMKAPIFASELAELTRLDLGSRGILDLSGLEYAINLRTLNLTGNSVTDISALRPGRVLSGEAAGNLVGMPQLEALALDATTVEDLLPLETLANLRLLSMDRFVLTTSDEGPLQAEYFELDAGAGPAQFPDWSALEPYVTRTDLQSAADGFGDGLAGFAELQGVLGARWSGQLLVEAPGAFSFALTGGTAARLYIDDMAVPLGPKAILTASRDGPGDGRLAEDLRFTLQQGDATALVELAAADTEAFDSLDQLIDALNLELQGSAFVAGRDGERITFTTAGDTQPIEFVLEEGDSGPAGLGFSGRETSVLLSSDSVTIALGEGPHELRYEVVGLDNADVLGKVLSWSSMTGSARLVFPDLDEALARVGTLHFLSLADSALVNVDALARLDGLERLYLEGNDIRDIGALAGAAIVDDGDDGFTVLGGAFQRNILPVERAFEQDYLFAPSLAAGEGAQWTFENLNDGRYELFATWLPHEARAKDVHYAVTDVNGDPLEVRGADGALIQAPSVDQRSAPDGADLGGRPWHSLGFVDVVGGVVRVTLTGPADGFVAADAMRLAAVAPVLPKLRALNLEGNPLDSRAQEIHLPQLEASVAALAYDANAAPEVDPVLPQVVLPSGALSFDGADDVVSVADHPALDIAKQLTVEITFSVDPADLAALGDDWMPLVSKGDGFASPYTVALNKAGFLRFSSLDTSGAVSHVDTPVVVDFAAGGAQTVHFTGVMDRNAHRLQAYVDGKLVGETALFFRAAQPAVTVTVKQPVYVTLPFGVRIVVGYVTKVVTIRPAIPALSYDATVNAKSLQIGNTDAQDFAPLKASVDEVRIWSRALGGAEVATLANRDLTGGENGLVGLFKFEGRSLDAVTDSTGKLQGVLGDGSDPATKPTRDGLLALSVSDADGDPVVLKAVSSDPGVVVNVVGSALNIAPDPAFAGTARITVTAEDGSAANPRGGVREVRFDFTAGANALYGTKFRDLNANGVRDEGEPGLESVRFFLDDNGNGVLDPGERSTYTDANGQFAFTGLLDPARVYTLVEIPPPGLRPTDGLRARLVTFSEPGEIATGVDFAASADDVDAVDFGNVDNLAPVAAQDSYDTDEDTPLAVGVLAGLLANDSDPNLDVLTPELVSDAQHGVLHLNPDGSFTYDPDADFNGVDQFIYRAFDEELYSDPITVEIAVNPVNDAPVHQFSLPQSVDEDTKLVFSARRDNALTIRDVDAGADPVTVTLTALNGTLRFDTEPGADFATYTITDTVAAINNFLEGFVFVPLANFNGAASIEVTTDDLGHSGAGLAFVTTDTIAITVNPVDDPTVAIDDAFAILEDGSLAAAAPGVLGNDLEVDGDPLVARVVSGASHGALAFNPDGSFGYVPAPDFYGVDSFSYRVNDGVSDSNLATVTLAVAPVNDVPAFTAGPDVARGEDAGPQAIAGWASGISAGPANEASQALEFLLATSDPGLFSELPAISPEGTLTFTSAPDAHGSATVEVKLRDDGGTANGGQDTSAPQVFTITILPVNDAPTFTMGPDLVVDEDAGPQVFDNWATDISVGPADEAGQTYVFEVTNDLAALFDEQPTIDTQGTLRFTPKADAFGTANVSIVLRDDGGTANGGSDASPVQQLKITVAPINDRPAAIGAAFDVAEDQVLSDMLEGFDVDGDPLTFSVFGPGPVHGVLDLAPDGAFTYTPSHDYFGPDTFGFRVSDGITSSLPGVVTVNVTPVNDAPVANPDSYDLVEDEPLDLSVFGPAFGVLANDLDVDGDPLSAVKVDDPAHGALVLNEDGTFLYTPDTNFFGDDSFTYQAQDPSGERSLVTTVSLFVENQNDAPVASDVTPATDEDTPLEAILPASDPDGDALTFEILTGPTHGTLDLLDDGAFRYTPAQDYFGADAFTFRASDGQLPSNTGTVTIEVAPVNDAPVLGPLENQEGDEGVALTFTATATDVDALAGELVFSLVGAPEGATINGQTGLFSWTPSEAQGPGEYGVTVRVTDGGVPQKSDEVMITLKVNEVNLAPVLDPIENQTVDEGTEVSFTAAASDADLPENGLTFSLEGAPAGASIDPDSGLFSWTPTEAQGPQSYSFDVVVTDDAADAKRDAQTVTVTVKEVNLPPVLDPIGDQAVSEGELLSFAVGASDPDLPANVLTFSAGGLPAGASFDPATRIFSWMPDETQGPGAYAVTFRVSDGDLSDEETIGIAVSEDSSLDAGPQANDGAPDTFRLVRNGADLEGYLNGVRVFVREFADVTDLSVHGSADDDTLIVDFSGGDPLPSTGLAYDGGGPGDHDTLVLTGGTVGSVVYTPFDAHSGTVSVDGELITYGGLEPITDDLLAVSREFAFGAGDDTIDVAIGAERTLLTSPSSESVDFVNPTGTLTIRAGDGDDVITVTGMPAYELLIDAGGGNNTIVSSVPIGALVTGTEGADAIDIGEAAGVLSIDVNGALSTLGGADKLIVDALGGPDAVTLHELTIPATVDGGPGDDVLDASGVSAAGVVLRGGEGDDTLVAGGGLDTLDGGPGEDTAVLKGITPIAYWGLNETSGSAVADSAGAPQDGVFFGRSPDLDDPGPPASLAPFGAQTGADFHDTRREYIAVEHDAAFEVAQGTIQLWFRTRDAWDNQTLFAKDQDGRSNGLRIRLDDRDLRVQMEEGGAVHAIDTRYTEFANLVRSNTWYQLTFTFGTGGMKLYVDGVLVGTNAYTGGLTGNHEPIVIGGSNGNHRGASDDLSRLRITAPFDGQIDEVAFYGVALAPEQIAQARARGALGVVAPQDAADVLVDIERIVVAPQAQAVAFTADPAVQEAGTLEFGTTAGEGWVVLAQCTVELNADEPSGWRGATPLRHASAEPALFSVERIGLAADGRVVLREAAPKLGGLDGWIRPVGDGHAEASRVAEPPMPPSRGTHVVDWDAPSYGLGVAPVSGRSGGPRAAEPNFAQFERPKR